MSVRPSTDMAIDDFVARVNAGTSRLADANQVPPALRDGEVDAHGQVGWRITGIPGAPWIATLETRLPGHLPQSFRSLVCRYAFPAFALGPVLLFGNTGEAGLGEELTAKIFGDKVMADVLLARGYVQVGWPVGVWYDPVCFDLNRRRTGGECPLVQLDHEAVLQHGRIKLVKEIAASFLDLVDRALPGPNRSVSR